MIRRTCITICCAMVALAAAPAGAAADPTASAARSCSTVKYPGSGYFTSLKTTGLSCTTGRTAMRAHYRCRVRRGHSGYCSRVSGYRCSETRRRIPTQYAARVTCTRGSKRVVYTYSQVTT